MKDKMLQKGYTIGIVAPASLEEEVNIDKGVNLFEKLGYKVKKGRHIYDRWGYFAGRDEERAKDIMDMFLDEEVDIILCIRGGYGAMRILNFLDFEKIKANPKIFIGYSDITVLLNTFAQRCNFVTFHGPMLTSNFEDQETLNGLLYTITNGYEPYDICNPQGISIESNCDSVVEGKLIGGNLSLITSTMGTPYEIDMKDNILFIEDVGETPYRIDRMLTQLLLSGKLQETKAIILGQFTNCDEDCNHEDNFTLAEVINDRIRSLNKPIMMNFMSGHSYPKLTIPIGAKIRVDFREKIIKIIEPVFN